MLFSLETLSIASNERSHPSLRPKRRARRAPFGENTFPPIRKSKSSYLETLNPEKYPSFPCYKARLEHLTSSKLSSSCKLLSIISSATIEISVSKKEAYRNK